jgi:hypothetical protein
MDFTKTNLETLKPMTTKVSRFDGRSFICGLILAFSVSASSAVAFDLGGIASSVKNLVNIKKNLDSDVRLLTEDAKVLIGSKDKLLLIKNSLMKLATETKSQIDLITTLVGEVEGHLKRTQTNIQTTATHVGEIDSVRKALQGKK